MKSHAARFIVSYCEVFFCYGQFAVLACSTPKTHHMAGSVHVSRGTIFYRGITISAETSARTAPFLLYLLQGYERCNGNVSSPVDTVQRRTYKLCYKYHHRPQTEHQQTHMQTPQFTSAANYQKVSLWGNW